MNVDQIKAFRKVAAAGATAVIGTYFMPSVISAYHGHPRS